MLDTIENKLFALQEAMQSTNVILQDILSILRVDDLPTDAPQVSGNPYGDNRLASAALHIDSLIRDEEGIRLRARIIREVLSGEPKGNAAAAQYVPPKYADMDRRRQHVLDAAPMYPDRVVPAPTPSLKDEFR